MNAGAPLIFRIRRFSLDDGPGIRTTIFFKGCPLACSWCHNPEGIPSEPRVLIQESRCIHCGDCFEACPRNGETPCLVCGKCIEACPSGARSVCGTHYSVKALVPLLLKDRAFWEGSGGGVTLSGGEPTLDLDYAGRLARCLKASGVHVALETCGHFAWEHFRERLLPFVDLVFYDLKLIDPVEHRKHTGVGNAVILTNLARLQEAGGPKVIVRTPLVSGITDGLANLVGIREFLQRVGVHDHRLLPFNPCIPAFRSQGAEPCRSTSITL
jgi:pyruvate formate lyase activating enzyme